MKPVVNLPCHWNPTESIKACGTVLNANNTDYTLTALQKEEMINPFNLWFPSMKPAGGSVLSNDMCSLLMSTREISEQPNQENQIKVLDILVQCYFLMIYGKYN